MNLWLIPNEIQVYYWMLFDPEAPLHVQLFSTPYLNTKIYSKA